MNGTERFLNDNFGDADGVLGLLAKHDRPVPNREAARKWFVRGSLTAAWLIELMVALQRETGRLADMEAYVDGAENDIFG